jgi:uncharacterized protein
MNNYSHFKTQSGKNIFYYNNDNILFNENLQPINSFNYSDDHIQYAKQNHGVTFKSNKPQALRIQLGHACNYSCTYCMQKDIGNPDERPKRDRLDDFFDSIRKNLDLSNLYRVELWGGEPLLYWNDIVPLMKFLDSYGVNHFYISTNGSGLRLKHAEFFSTLKAEVQIAISHDGPGHERLRGEEIFDKPKVIETLKAFDNISNISYSFNSVISNTNYDLYKINNFFRDVIIKNGLKTKNVSFEPARTYVEHSECVPVEVDGKKVIPIKTKGTGESTAHVIQGENLEKFRIILSSFLEDHYNQFIKFGFDENGQPDIFNKTAKELDLLEVEQYYADTGSSVISYARNTIRGIPGLQNTRCGADAAEVLSLDLDGVVITCPHTDDTHTMGNINKLDEVNISKLNLNRKTSHCDPCPNKKICRSSCPINLLDSSFYANCALEKILYGETQKAAFRFIFGEKINLVKSGIESITEYNYTSE